MTRTASPTEGLLSIADISRHFSLPESTTRYYCKRFAAFIPSVGEGRRRRYRPETLEVIAAILEQMRKSRTAASVENALLARFPAMRLPFPSQSLPDASGASGCGTSARSGPAVAGTPNTGLGGYCPAYPSGY